MNTVTPVARDESDPEIQWRLEELGGAVPSTVLLTERSGGTAGGFAQAGYAGRRETDRV